MNLFKSYFALLVIFAVTTRLPAAPPAADDPWRDTTLAFDFIDERVNTTACHESEITFLSCIGATQAILDAHGSQLRLVSIGEFGEIEHPAQILKRFEGVAIIETRGRRFLDNENALVLLRDRARDILRWLEHYPGRQGDKIDFSAIIDWLLTNIVDDRHAKAFAAAAINGYLRVGDAHARIMPATTVRGTSSGRPGSRGSGNGSATTYTGIGASIQGVGEGGIVSSVLRDGPADKAGIRVHDVILAVDAELVTDLPPSTVVSRLRGPRGSDVTVTVKRQDELRTFMVTRERVSVKNVYTAAFVDRGWQFGLLRIDSFVGGNTCAEARRGLNELLKPTLNGIILDLRNNVGGLIEQAACVADLFLPPGQVVLEARDVDRPERSRRLHTRRGQLTDVPMVTLVNATTASASEILAGALQDHGRSFVVGERTFGKGTVQKTRPWNRSSSVLEFYTAARYYRPSGASVQLVGIEPDLPALAQPGPRTSDWIVLREGDLFPTALPRESGEWIQPRPESVTALAKCVSEKGLAEERWKKDTKKTTPTDHALLVAQDHLTCMLQRRIF